METTTLTVRLKEKSLSEQELAIILNGLPPYSRERIMIECLMVFGIRTKEMCELHIANFSEDLSKMTYIPCKQGKVKKTYTRYIPEWFRIKLRKYMSFSDLAKSGGYLFRGEGHGTKQTNRGYKPHTFRSWFVKYRERLYKQGHKFVKDPYQVICYEDGSKQELYRCSLHVFRSNWITSMLNHIIEKSTSPERDVLMFSKTVHSELKTTWKYYRPLAAQDLLLSATMMVFGAKSYKK